MGLWSSKTKFVQHVNCLFKQIDCCIRSVHHGIWKHSYFVWTFGIHFWFRDGSCTSELQLKFSVGSNPKKNDVRTWQVELRTHSNPNMENPKFEPFRTLVRLPKPRTLQKSWTPNSRTGFDPTSLIWNSSVRFFFLQSILLNCRLKVNCKIL